ncbi:hypothetical protein A2763_04700 [Candidatus Kaiserbacteria bacterium RIFCSPHIGHO2_01_FULL_54_36]|uniref:Uncharacterized protein n=1 Tax=Candidatus Kaiserbacteria bacterium RIFCSPHIGHO2_01_FULL_54_36 TaxID=1798482 RepID=A0A1F6CMD9_9BACT|nr:MAG: hypothetical protein A2763_04700 [Candidatus Kaiserbacteria bacterium RIFCSPHIGHO2_01_FULL_54_36]OGG75067.1 MAG: hypothetical protein A3A41_02130 [Candidatus Kaiserbacteria bacterium RIFCSPLOWO2_01_FULL_54_22]
MDAEATRITLANLCKPWWKVKLGVTLFVLGLGWVLLLPSSLVVNIAIALALLIFPTLILEMCRLAWEVGKTGLPF